MGAWQRVGLPRHLTHRAEPRPAADNTSNLPTMTGGFRTRRLNSEFIGFGEPSGQRIVHEAGRQLRRKSPDGQKRIPAAVLAIAALLGAAAVTVAAPAPPTPESPSTASTDRPQRLDGPSRSTVDNGPKRSGRTGPARSSCSWPRRRRGWRGRLAGRRGQPAKVLRRQLNTRPARRDPRHKGVVPLPFSA